MINKAVLFVATGLTMITLASTLVAQSSDAWFGTWVINVEKSKFAGPPPPPGSRILKMEPMPRGIIKTTLDTVNPQGQLSHTESISSFDGRDVPVAGADPANTRAYRRIDSHTYEVDFKTNGETRSTNRIVISRDGKTRIETGISVNPQGQTVAVLLVYDKK